MRSADYLPLSGPCARSAVRVQSQTRRFYTAGPRDRRKRESPGPPPGGFSLPRDEGSAHVSGDAGVITARPRVPQEDRERGPGDDVGAALGALAVTDRNDAGQVGGHLDAATVLVAPAGLPPDGLRQVSHGSLQLISELPEIDRGVGWFQRAIDRFFERLDVPAHLIRLIHLHDREVGFRECDARLALREVEDVDRRAEARRRAIGEPLYVEVDVGAPAHLDQMLDLVTPLRPRAPLVPQGRLGDHGGQHRGGAARAAEDLLPPRPGVQHLAAPGRWPRPDAHEGLGVILRLRQPGQDQRHEHPDPAGIVLEAGELVLENIRVVTPPWPRARLDGQLLELLPLVLVDGVDAEQVPDIAHFGAFPLISLEPPHLAPAPVQHVADVVSGVPTLDAQLEKAPGQPALGYGGAVCLVGHSGSPP